MKTGKSIRGALSYNEQKVSAGKAELILASRFGGDIADMSFSEKLNRFQKRNALNVRSKTNTLHLSLNFSPDDRLDTELLQRIAGDYMHGIGFGNQPFLVYQHHDAAHPHVHIITTTVQQNGKAIYLHNIGRLQSEPTRKRIEQEYSLVVAETKRKEHSLPLSCDALKVACYGKDETKRVLSNIVREITASYQFSSLDELNAVLRQYRVIADKGPAGSRMAAAKGLVYSLLDPAGNKIGVPIKASTIYSRPTLSYLEKRFEVARVKKLHSRGFLASLVEGAILQTASLHELSLRLAKNGISCQVIAKPGNDAVLYFIDNKRKVVFRSDDLAITGTIVRELLASHPRPTSTNSLPVHDVVKNTVSSHLTEQGPFALLNQLFAAEQGVDEISPEFLRKKKRKKKR